MCDYEQIRYSGLYKDIHVLNLLAIDIVAHVIKYGNNSNQKYPRNNCIFLENFELSTTCISLNNNNKFNVKYVAKQKLIIRFHLLPN